MGWYTSNGEETFQYRYGDLIGLARRSGLGQLRIAIRLEGEDDEGEPIDEEPFLGPLQTLAAELGQPFCPSIPFDLDEDPSGESVPVPHHVDLWARMQEWAGIILLNLPAVIAALRASCDEDELQVASLHLGAEPQWSLPAEDYPALLAWLNEPLPTDDRFTLDDLGAGSLQDDWYVPPPSVTRLLEHLDGDEARTLGFQALGHTLVESSPLTLYQPADDYTATIWAQDSGPVSPLAP